MKFKNFVILFTFFIVVGLLLGGGIYYSIKKKRTKIIEKRNYALNLIEKKEYDEALKALADVYPDVKGSGIEPDILFLLADTHIKREQFTEAKDYAQRLVDKYPKNPNTLKGKLILGEIAFEQENDMEKAQQYFDEVAESADAPDAAKKAKYLNAKIMAQNGDLEPAKAALEELYAGELEKDTKDLVEVLLGKININLLKSRALMEGDILYELEKGDSIYKISRQFKVPENLLMVCNGITDANRLAIGKRIKIPNAQFSLLVDKSDNTMTLLNHGKFFKKYIVRTGTQDHLTPIGSFKIGNKKKDPTWADPNTHKVYKSTDPENELGTRWMGFVGDSLGIHGTINADTLGKYTSNGCIGMKMEEAEEIFDLITIGTPLEIKGKMKTGSDKTKKTKADQEENKKDE